MYISMRYPTQWSDDARYSVRLREPGTPWPFWFHFLAIGDSKGIHEWVNIGFEVGEPWPMAEGLAE